MIGRGEDIVWVKQDVVMQNAATPTNGVIVDILNTTMIVFLIVLGARYSVNVAAIKSE